MDDIINIKEALIKLEDTFYLQRKGEVYKCLLEVIDKLVIERALEHTEGNQIKAARILGINRNTIRAKIKKLGVNPGFYKF